jgi:hypothetical protein
MAYDNNLTRLPDPTTNPQGPGFVSVSLTNNSPGVSHRLNTGGSIGVQFSGDYWSISIGYPELTIAQGDILLPYLYSVSGGFRNFYVAIPGKTIPKTGAWNVSSAALRAEGAITLTSPRELTIPSWSTRGGDLSAGDAIKFTNSNKIYLITSTTLVSNTKKIFLNSDVLEPSKMPAAGFQPNNILFRVKMEGVISPE